MTSIEAEAQLAQKRSAELSKITLEYINGYDKDELSKELASRNDPEGVSRRGSTLQEIQYKDEDYVKQLEICNKMWYLGGLVKELQPLKSDDIDEKWESIDFPGSVRSLIKLRGKLNDTIDELRLRDQYIRIFDELGGRVREYYGDEMHLIQKYLANYLAFSTDLSVTYSNKVNGLVFSSFLKSCNDYTTSNDSDLNRLFKLTKQLNDWTEKVLQKVDEGEEAELDVGGDTVSLTFKQLSGPVSFESYTRSIENLINFYNALISMNKIQESWDPFQNLKPVVGKTILQSLKSKILSEKYVYPLLVARLNADTNDPMTKSLKVISDLLSQEGWSKDGLCEIEFWMDDLVSCWVNDLVGKSMDSLKELVTKMRRGSFKSAFETANLISEDAVSASSGQAQTNRAPQTSTEPEPASEEPAEVDGWNEEWDDGWDEESKNEKASLKNKDTNEKNEDEPEDEEKKEKNDDEEADAWDDGWDDWDEERNEPKVDAAPKETPAETVQRAYAERSVEMQQPRSSFKYTVIADTASRIIDDYYHHLSQLREQVEGDKDLADIEMQFDDGTKKLMIGFFMMIESDEKAFYPSEILFYNDYSKLMADAAAEHQVDLTSCAKLAYSIVGVMIKSLSRTPTGIVDKYSPFFFEDGYSDTQQRERKSPEFVRRISEIYAQIYREFLSNLSLNEPLVSSIYMAVTSTTYNGISNRLLAREEIGSDECDILGEIIEKTLDATTDASAIGARTRKTPSYNKLDQVRLIIVSNLKTILSDFYDAKYYELGTHEMIRLIKALFVDSPKRQDTIDQIMKAREGSD